MTAPTLSIRYDSEDHDPAWDAFVVRAPGGQHVQTSLWAQIKRVMRWQAVRIALVDGDEIVAGAQVLYRQVMPLVRVGYVTNGPLAKDNSDDYLQRIVAELCAFSRKSRLLMLTLQPAKQGAALAAQLPGWRFRPGRMAVAPTASVIMDLRPGPDAIMAAMQPSTRQNIRRGLRRDVTVRQGTLDDIPLFWQLHTASSQRQGFSPYPEAYYRAMWQALEPHGYIRMFIAQVDGEDVSAQLIVPFGDTVISKSIGWSGAHRNRQPNRVLDWAAIEWSIEAGYSYFDFEGIQSSVARTLLAGQPLPESEQQSPISYKLGFGGQVVLFPEPYDYLYSRLLRQVYGFVADGAAQWPLSRRVVQRLQGRRPLDEDDLVQG